jgi:hypothetical protein
MKAVRMVDKKTYKWPAQTKTVLLPPKSNEGGKNVGIKKKHS